MNAYREVERDEVTFTLKMVDYGTYATRPLVVEKVFSTESTKDDREEVVQAFRRFLVACGYPCDPTMEKGYKTDD